MSGDSADRRLTPIGPLSSPRGAHHAAIEDRFTAALFVAASSIGTPAAARQHDHCRRPGGSAPCTSRPRARRRCGRSSTAASRCCTRSGSRRRSSPSTTVLNGDPRCAMAHWGIAMSWWGNPFGGFRVAAGARGRPGRGRRGQGHAAAAPTARSAYLAAVDALFRDAATRDQRTRTVAYEKAMEALAARYPDDVEARIFYALALGPDGAADRQDLRQPAEGRRILEEEFARQPEHPGLAHYIIHSFDVPPLAPRALDAARRYATHRARRAARAPHAVAHLHARRPVAGLDRRPTWRRRRRRARTRRRVRGAARARLSGVRVPADGAGRRGGAHARRWSRRWLAAIPNAGAGNAAPPSAGYYAVAAIPARYALERARVGRGRRARAARRRRSPGPTPSRTSRGRSAPREAAASPRRVRTSTRLAALRDAVADDQRRLLDRAGRDPAARRRGVGGAGRGPAGRGADADARGGRRARTRPRRRRSRPARSSRRANCWARCCCS